MLHTIKLVLPQQRGAFIKLSKRFTQTRAASEASSRHSCIYLDYNATTPIFPEVQSAMSPFLFQHFGNPSSGHTYGKVCKAALEKARAQVSKLVNARPDEIFFTSSGTESDNWAIYGAVMSGRMRMGGGRVPHVVASVIEHPAVIQILKHLQEQGLATYTTVPVDSEGIVKASDIQAAITSDTVLVTVMHSNNEVGSLQPVKEIAAVAHEAGILCHTDAAQSLGKVPIDVETLDVDLLTIVGHKFGAPKGVAALYIKRGTVLSNFFHGGGQELGRRSATENVLLCVGLGEAAQIAHDECAVLTQHMRAMRDSLQAQLLAAFTKDSIRINGPTNDSLRLPNTLSVCIKGLNSQLLLQRLSEKLAASAGSACHSHDGPAVTGVLAAMKVPVEFAVGTLRLSTGRHTTQADIDQAVRLIVDEARAQGLPVDL